MIAVDTNILIYAHRADAEFHQSAREFILRLAEGTARWAIPWPCLHEFVAIATHPRIYSPPSTIKQAVEQIDVWLESPSLVTIGESVEHWKVVRNLVNRGKVVGPMVHDARVAAICGSHGVTTLYTADRDFSRFDDLNVSNPLIRP